MKATTLTALLVVTLLLTSSARVSADDNRYRYKFPCYSPSNCWVTQLAHINNALDFDPLGGDDLGAIPAMAEGVVAFRVSDATTCTGIGLGRFVGVSDIHGRLTTYAHLSAFAAEEGAVVFQGDQVGVEGNTGNSAGCEPHLYWEPGGSLPTYINNVAVSSLCATCNYSASNTNSVIGEYSTAGATLRTYYDTHGRWNSIGWTHKHCPGACTLNMTANLSWGRMQDFRHHIDFFGGEFATIHVANWDTAHAYRVDSIFWPAWAGGAWDVVGTLRPISMARQESGGCPSGSAPSCVSYQRFHLGYVWVNTGGQAAAGFCPDVFPLPNGDGLVAASDAQWVFSFYQNGTYDARADIDGNGAITPPEAQLVFAHFQAGVRCWP